MLRQLLIALVVCGLLVAPLALPAPVSQARALPAATEAVAAVEAQSLLAPTACPTDLFFSEYIEGSSNNKALEIYNGTGADITFTSNYTVGLFSNGGTTVGNVAVLSGTLAAGDVYVIVNASANITISAQADLTSTVTFYNGDDALALYHNGVIIDAFGQIGFDPGTEWGTGLTSTLDNTLVRKSSITAGDPISNDVFSPTVEWDGFANDTFIYLGSHTMDSCQTVLEADLGISKDGPTTALAGENITYTLSLSNTGTYTATGTIITDTLPTEVTFITYTTALPFNTFTQTGQDLIWDLGDVPTTTANAIISVRVAVSPTVLNGTSFTNTVAGTTTYTETNLANNGDFATTFIGAPDLAIVKSGPASVNAGDTFTYTLTYSNAGTINATGVAIVDQLPAGVTFVTETTASAVVANGQITWTVGALNVGAGGSIDVAVTADNAGDWVNTATISGGPVDSDLLNNTASVTTTINGVDVYVSKTGPAVAFGGELISYTITYGNSGNLTATATLTDQLPISFTLADIA
ncbi:partial Large cysteine-rich periplasmic protein OmcB, serovar C, partial [Gammaproteobacteria bacterium]